MERWQISVSDIITISGGYSDNGKPDGQEIHLQQMRLRVYCDQGWQRATDLLWAGHGAEEIAA